MTNEATKAAEAMREAAIKAADDERVDGEVSEGDWAYNTAISHVISAIRALPLPASPAVTLTGENFTEEGAPNAKRSPFMPGALTDWYAEGNKPPVGLEEGAPMVADPEVRGDGKTDLNRACWYLGAMNDAAFIIDGPPSPADTDVGPHFEEHKPRPVSAAIDDKNGKLIVEAHNRIVATLRAENAALRAEMAKAPAPRDEALRIAREALDSIRQYGSDTLSGPSDPQYREKWFRDGVSEMTRRARSALVGLRGDFSPAPDTRRTAEEIRAEIERLTKAQAEAARDGNIIREACMGHQIIALRWALNETETT